MTEIVDRSLERVRRRRNDIEFDVDLTPWQVYGDGSGLGRAVLNVLDNAAKWSPTGGRVGVRLTQVDPMHAELVVADQGPGIPPQERRLRIRAVLPLGLRTCDAGFGTWPGDRETGCAQTRWRAARGVRRPRRTAAGHRDSYGAARQAAARRVRATRGRGRGLARGQRRQWLAGARWGKQVCACPEGSLSGFSARLGNFDSANAVVLDVGPTTGRAPQRYDQPPEVFAATASRVIGPACLSTRHPDTPVRSGPIRTSSSRMTGDTRPNSSSSRSVRPMTRIAVPLPATARYPQAPMPAAASEAFSRRRFDSGGARGGHRVRRYRRGSRAACAARPARSHVEHQRRRPRHACRQPACRLGRTGRGEGRSQRRQARGGPRQAIRGGLRDHPVVGRPDLDEQPCRLGGPGRTGRPAGRVDRLRRAVGPRRPR